MIVFEIGARDTNLNKIYTSMRIIAYTIFLLITFQNAIAQTDFNSVSENLLQAVIDNKSTLAYQDVIANATIQDLQNGLDTDTKKLAFWVNVYNAYIQIILRLNPEMYKDKSGFFKIKQIPVAGMQLAFADIEHGIIRGSQHEYFLGYVKKLFPPQFEKDLGVSERDFRVHFALNCGAKDCPPVAVYTEGNLDYEFDYMSKRYLTTYTEVDVDRKEIQTAQLFAWFRGDFGGSEGIRHILVDYNVIPKSPRYRLYQKKYDWTLKLDNFVDIPIVELK